jgi:hypothetical protein
MWTECPRAATAGAVPDATTSAKPASDATSHSTSTSVAGRGIGGSSRVHRISESASGSPDATPSVNGSDVTIGGVVVEVVDVVVDEVVDVVVVEDGPAADVGVASVGGTPVDPLDDPASSSEQAASAAPTAPARNPRRVRRGAVGGSLTDGSNGSNGGQ